MGDGGGEEPARLDGQEIVGAVHHHRRHPDRPERRRHIDVTRASDCRAGHSTRQRGTLKRGVQVAIQPAFVTARVEVAHRAAFAPVVDRLHPRREVLFGERARMVDIGLPIRECRHQDQPGEPFWMRRGVDDGGRTAVTMPDHEHPLGARGIGHRRHVRDAFIDRRDRARPVGEPDAALVHHDQAGTRGKAMQERGEDRVAPLHVEMRQQALEKEHVDGPVPDHLVGDRASLAVGVLSPWPHMTPPVALCRLLTQVTSTFRAAEYDNRATPSWPQLADRPPLASL